MQLENGKLVTVYITDTSLTTIAKLATIASCRTDDYGRVMYKVKPLCDRRREEEPDLNSLEFCENAVGIYPCCNSLSEFAPFIHTILGQHFDLLRHIPNNVEKQAEFYRVLLNYMLMEPDRICCSRNFKDTEAQAGGFSLELFRVDKRGCVACSPAVVTFDYNVASGNIYVGAAS